MMCSCFFFCKQMTAYEVRISDWSSVVCSSGLATERPFERVWRQRDTQWCRLQQQRQAGQRPLLDRAGREIAERRPNRFLDLGCHQHRRTAERRVGKDVVSTCTSWWLPSHQQKKQT